MGVYINMKMPFCCLVCPCSGADNTDDGNEVMVCEASKLRQLTTEDKIDRRPEWCPLVPVPPHGRLLKVLKTERECVSRDCNRDCGKCDLSLEQDEVLSAYDFLITLFADPAEEGE